MKHLLKIEGFEKGPASLGDEGNFKKDFCSQESTRSVLVLPPYLIEMLPIYGRELRLGLINLDSHIN